MNPLLEKKPFNKNVTQEEFLDDLKCLFENLKELYGMYSYWGEDKFSEAYIHIQSFIHEGDEFDFNKTYRKMLEELSFIKDGHFCIGEPHDPDMEYDYAIRYAKYKGIPVIDCKKFYGDTEEELNQLDEFANKGLEYRNQSPLIIDLRGNHGGNTTYIYDFLVGLLDEDIGYPYKMVQRSSPLFREWLRLEGTDWAPEGEITGEEHPEKIQNQKKIYVLLDEITGSAAEEAIAFLKNIENTLIVGYHSAGCVSCGNCIQLYLPHSHLAVYFGTGLMLYGGNINIDAEGGFKGDISFEEFDKMINFKVGQ